MQMVLLPSVWIKVATQRLHEQAENSFVPQQKKKKDRLRSAPFERQIPDAPTLEEFECLLGESPTNYPRGEGIENMESELHSAAIDMGVYEREATATTEILIDTAEEETNCDVDVSWRFSHLFSYKIITLYKLSFNVSSLYFSYPRYGIR